MEASSALDALLFLRILRRCSTRDSSCVYRKPRETKTGWLTRQQRFTSQGECASQRIVQSLLAAGGNPNSLDDEGSTSLHHAEEIGSAKAVRILLALICAGADPAARNTWGYTPLHHAAELGTAELVRALLAAGADTNVAGNDGWTPLHAAVSANIVEVAQALLDAGADSNAQDNDGRTPDDVACEEVKEFLDARRAFLEEKALIDCLPPARSSSRRAQL